MIHNLSDVQSKNIGKNTNIWQFCVILEGASIGNNCNINCNVFIENDVIIKDNVTIKSGVQVWNGIFIDSDVFIGPNVTFTNDLLPRSKQYPEQFSKTIIEQGVSIGANSTILSGNKLGKYCLIGAGSLVTKDIPPFTLWYGVPATFKGYITKEGTVVNKSLIGNNGKKYKIIKGEPIEDD